MTDYKYGIEMEQKMMPNINDFIVDLYGKTIKKTEGKYNLFDFKAKKIRVELKSRRVDSFTYQDTMIDNCKILKGLRLIEQRQYNIYFFFHFDDGLFYYKLKEGDNKRLRLNRFKGVKKNYIDIKNLIKI